MAFDPNSDPRRSVRGPDDSELNDPTFDKLKPGEVPRDPHAGHNAQTIVWIVAVVVLVVGGAILIGAGDASSPQASIQNQHLNSLGG